MKISKIKISMLLARKKMRQQDLADNARMSRGNLSCIINGKTCKASTAMRIADALGVDVAEILEDE